MAEIRQFCNLARPLQIGLHRRKGPPRRQKGEYEMSNFSVYLRHAMAAAAAVFISGLLFVNSLAVSAHEVNSVVGILA